MRLDDPAIITRSISGSIVTRDQCLAIPSTASATEKAEVAGVARLAPGERVSLVGSTGAYRGVAGELETAPPVKGYDSVDVLHLEG